MTTLDHYSFSCLRHDHDREWYRLSDLIDASQAAGYRMTQREVRKATQSLEKPEKAYGHCKYGREHLIAVVEFATAMVRRDTEDRNDA